MRCSSASLPAQPEAKSWRVSDFQDHIAVSQDGSALVTERITLIFEGELHGIHRTIPIEYPGPNGTNYELFLNVTSITDGSGGKLKYESSTSNGRPLSEDLYSGCGGRFAHRRDYLPACRMERDSSTIRTNFIGMSPATTGLCPSIMHRRAFSFPDSAAGSLRAQAFSGVYGSTQHDATAKVDGAEAQFETNNPLPMRGGLTIDVYIPQGILNEPSALTRLLWFVGGNPVVFFPLVMFAGMFLLWWYKGRDPDPGMSVAPMYEPPPGISPAEAGTLLDDSIHPRDITSTVVDLAVRGYIKIEETAEKVLLFTHKDYVFHLLKPREQWGADLAPHERVMLENVFAGGAEARLSSLKNRFYTAVPVIRQDIMSALKTKGIYLLDPESANGYSIGMAVAIVIPFVIFQYMGWANFFNSAPLLIVCGAISVVIWWLFARVMTAKTVKGARTRIAVLGFQEFMNRVDAERLKLMPPTTFEKYLAFAMALGVEHHWAQAFAGIVKDPPQWYVGPGGVYGAGFNPIFFSSSMHSMATDMHQVFVSAPRASSSGSGFGGGGGGGFSGGGFGGGGGSAF